MHGRDRRLHLVGPRAGPRQRVGDQRDALRDRGGVPARPVLSLQRDQLAAGAGAGRPPGIGQQHQREQAGDLAVVGQQAVQHAGEPDRLGGQLDAGEVGPGGAGVALVEDQIEHLEHGVEARGALLGRGHGERQAGRPDPLLGPADPLAHGRFGDEERVGDLAGREPTDGAQGERHLRRHREGGVAAQEQQHERVVAVVHRRRLGAAQRVGDLALPAGLLAAHLVDQPPRGDPDQPGLRVVGDAVGGPLHGGGEQRLLHRVLGGVEVPVAPHERAEHLRRELAQRLIHGGAHVISLRPRLADAGIARAWRGTRCR